MKKNNSEKRINVLEKRIRNLEKAVFNKKGKKENASNYKGLTGGINFLIDHGFFKKLVPVSDVHKELKKEGYVYSLQAVDTILRRDFVHKKKILTRDKENGVWKYALRK